MIYLNKTFVGEIWIGTHKRWKVKEGYLLHKTLLEKIQEVSVIWTKYICFCTITEINQILDNDSSLSRLKEFFLNSHIYVPVFIFIFLTVSIHILCSTYTHCHGLLFCYSSWRYPVMISKGLLFIMFLEPYLK